MYSFKELQKIINVELKSETVSLAGKNPAELYAPVKYSLEVGGKRLRPVLALMGFNMFSDDIGKAIPAALAVEFFHNFTLLHDDIMDNAGVRRNQPTVHKKFSENNAILSGDAMAFLSYRYLMQCNSSKLNEVINLFTDTALEVCEGQQYDMDFENRRVVSEAEYLGMIRLKTAVLIACSLKAGALLAEADDEITMQVYNFGINLGLAFQLQDDLLDTFGNQQTFGKEIGGDISANKKTYLLIKAHENASTVQKKELEKWLAKEEFGAEEKFRAILNLFNQLEIEKLTKQKIDSFFENASEILNKLPIPKEKKNPLEKLSNKMLGRNS